MAPLTGCIACIVTLAIAVSPPAALAQNNPSTKIAAATRAAIPPRIDGRDDDDVWKKTPLIDQFLEQQPTEGAKPRLPTTARVAYDDENLYVFVRAFDPHPDSIVGRLSRRDSDNTSDRVGLYIDSYLDRRTAYHLIVNAAGVKSDGYFYDDVQQDLGWDGVWDVATRIDSAGWTAEFRVPFSQMRFSRGDRHTFGFAVRRVVARYGDLSGWPLIRPSQLGVVSQMGDLKGIDTRGPTHPVELAPYVVTKSVPRAPGLALGQRTSMTGGADARIGLAPNLTLTGAINPDFGQVEADPAVLNLSAFETFYPERRPFFLEGQNIFGFSLSRNDGAPDALFYSRRIGREPQLRDRFGDATSARETQILGAGKVTGRTARGLSFGALGAETSRQVGAWDSVALDERTIEPNTQYFAARVQQEVNQGRTGASVMMTGVHRSLDEFTTSFLRREAVTGGLDLRHRFAHDSYIVSGYIAGSSVSGSQAAILRTQLASIHFFQRPAAAMPVDSSRTRLAGSAAEISLSKARGVFQWVTDYRRLSPGFESNDIGFLGRADWQAWSNWFGVNSTKATRRYQYAGGSAYIYQEWTTDGLPTERMINLSGYVGLPSLWQINPYMIVGQLPGTFCTGCARGGPAIRHDRRQVIGTTIIGDTRRMIAPQLDVRWTRDEQGRTQIYRAAPRIDVRPSPRTLWSVGMSGVQNHDNAQFYGLRRDASGAAHYLFAHLDQTTFSVQNRINVTITPALSFEWYAEPFVSAGHFSDVREVADPGSAEYDKRYRPYADPTVTGDPGGLHFRQLRSNAVARWEYRPGSVLYLVWNQGRDYSDNVAESFALGREERGLFAQRPANTILVKASYWINR